MRPIVTSQVKIRPARPSDALSVRSIAISAQIDAWSESAYLGEISRDGSIITVAEDPSEKIIGFVLGRKVPGVDAGWDLEIFNIAVRTDLHRVGIGSRLIGSLLETADREHIGNLWLEVRESNLNAINFYKKHGFLQWERRRSFYSDPVEDALLMGRPV